MPKWIHDRAAHIRAKNPSMSESMSWGIATQQSHSTGKSPRGYGTAKGKKIAKKKFSQPKKSYTQTADPKRIGAALVKNEKSKTAMEHSDMVISSELVRIESFRDELVKIAAGGRLGEVARRGAEMLAGGSRAELKQPGRLAKLFGATADPSAIGKRTGGMANLMSKDKNLQHEALKVLGARTAVGTAGVAGAAKAGKEHRKTERKQLGRAYVSGARDMYSRVGRR